MNICVRFTFWEARKGNGSQFFILTPPAMREDVPSKYPSANAVWTVEASTIGDAQSKMIQHFGWGPFMPFNGPTAPDLT